jgi:hypothetical protein
MPPGLWVAEYLNTKVTGGPKDTWFVHDVLELMGQSMLGVSYRTRLGEVLLGLTGTKNAVQNHDGYKVIEPNFWVPLIYEGNFHETYQRVIKKPEVEGLVLKNPNAALTMNNAPGWTVKSRKPHKNYPR